MKFTNWGLAVAFVAFALLLFSAAFHDFFVEVILLVLLIVIVAEAAWVGLATRSPGSKFILKNEEARTGTDSVLVRPGDESVENVRLTKRVGGIVELESRVNFLRIEPRVLRGTGNFRLEFRFMTEYAGRYTGEEVGIVVAGPLGLFSSRSTTSFAQKYVVHPRILQVAAATVKLLGRAEIGETPIEMPGVGSEYYEMRRYQAGDELRNVNWKASARQGELMVMERMKEVGSSLLLVLDARAPGFADTDRLASTFLSIANSLASSGVNFGILAHDGEKVISVSSEQDPRTSLGMALKTAVTITNVGSAPEFLELMPSRLWSRISNLQSETEAEYSLWQLQDLMRAQVRSTVQKVDPWAIASNYIRDRSTRSVAYVSGLFSRVEPLIELAWQARHYGDVDFVVVDPCMPRAGAEETREALELRKERQKLVGALGRAGIPCYTGEPLDLVRRIFAS
jgi:uncharacterized protein (DUF58 family)